MGLTIDKMYDESYVLVDGHRGVHARFPQNTLLSFQKAIDLGVDMIEFDVNMTVDGVPMVIHNPTVDATTDGTGPVRSFTLKEIKKLDAGCRFGDGSFAGQGLTIPTLEELVELCLPHDLLLNCEIKDYSVDCMDETLRILSSYPGLMERMVFTCFDGAVLSYLKEGYGVKCNGFHHSEMTNFTRGKYGTYHVMDAVSLFGEDVNRETSAFFEDFGILCWGSHAETAEIVAMQLEAGMRLVTCDDASEALKYLTEKGLHTR